MKALSLGLVKGSIDQVDKKVHMTWVQPRVLDRNQVKLKLNLYHTFIKALLRIALLFDILLVQLVCLIFGLVCFNP